MGNSNSNYDLSSNENNSGNRGPSPQALLGMFLAGLAMLIVGLFIFSQKVLVHTAFFSTGIRLGHFHVNSGLVIIPLIAGIVWIFVAPKNIGGKILSAIGVLIIIVSVIMSTTIHLVTMSLFDWILILVLIFGGAGLVLRVLLSK